MPARKASLMGHLAPVSLSLHNCYRTPPPPLLPFPSPSPPPSSLSTPSHVFKVGQAFSRRVKGRSTCLKQYPPVSFECAIQICDGIPNDQVGIKCEDEVMDILGGKNNPQGKCLNKNAAALSRKPNQVGYTPVDDGAIYVVVGEPEMQSYDDVKAASDKYKKQGLTLHQQGLSLHQQGLSKKALKTDKQSMGTAQPRKKSKKHNMGYKQPKSNAFESKVVVLRRFIPSGELKRVMAHTSGSALTGLIKKHLSTKEADKVVGGQRNFGAQTWQKLQAAYKR